MILGSFEEVARLFLEYILCDCLRVILIGYNQKLKIRLEPEFLLARTRMYKDFFNFGMRELESACTNSSSGIYQI